MIALDGRDWRSYAGKIDNRQCADAHAASMSEGMPQPDGAIRPEPTHGCSKTSHRRLFT